MGSLLSRPVTDLSKGSESRQSQSVPTTECWGKTIPVVHKADFTWEIHDFKTHLNANFENPFPCVKSPPFSPLNEPNLVIGFDLYPKGVTKESTDYMGLRFNLLSCPKASALIYYSLSILDNKRKKLYTIEGSHEFKKGTNKPFGWTKFVPIEDLRTNARELLPGNKLTVFFEITAYTDQLEITGSSSSDFSEALKLSENQLGGDFSRLLLPPHHLSDFVFIVAEKQFPVHKLILSTRSLIFAAMFKHSNAEKSGRVEVPDVDAAVFKELLYFIYTGRVSSKKKLTFELLAAANKFQVNSLKFLCEHALSESLKIDSVANALLQADFHDGAHLKANCIDFIVRHAAEVIETKAWKSLTATRPELAMPVFNRQHSILENNKKGAI